MHALHKDVVQLLYNERGGMGPQFTPPLLPGSTPGNWDVLVYFALKEVLSHFQISQGERQGLWGRSQSVLTVLRLELALGIGLVSRASPHKKGLAHKTSINSHLRKKQRGNGTIRRTWLKARNGE